MPIVLLLLVDLAIPFKSTILPFPLTDIILELYKNDLDSSFGRPIDSVLPVREVDKPPGREAISTPAASASAPDAAAAASPLPLLNLPGVNYFNL